MPCPCCPALVATPVHVPGSYLCLLTCYCCLVPFSTVFFFLLLLMFSALLLLFLLLLLLLLLLFLLFLFSSCSVGYPSLSGWMLPSPPSLSATTSYSLLLPCLLPAPLFASYSPPVALLVLLPASLPCSSGVGWQLSPLPAGLPTRHSPPTCQCSPCPSLLAACPGATPLPGANLDCCLLGAHLDLGWLLLFQRP